MLCCFRHLCVVCTMHQFVELIVSFVPFYKRTWACDCFILQCYTVGSNCVSSPLFHVEDLPESFLSQHRECCRRFSRWQMEAIESNLSCFEESLSHRQRKNLKLRKNFYVKTFIERYKVDPIDLSNWLVVKVRVQIVNPYQFVEFHWVLSCRIEPYWLLLSYLLAKPNSA
jgi:hypothetical protein